MAVRCRIPTCRGSDAMTDREMTSAERDLAAALADAAASGTRLSIAGGGSKAGVGRVVDGPVLSTAALQGIVDYDPAELVLTVQAGTPLSDIEALVAAEGQMLAFEPFDHGPIFGVAPGKATIGGVAAAGVSGSRRVSAGAARDHMLGLRAISGRGELFVAGARVVKNVTGYDLPKLAAGSWGRLFAITELTLKVLPRPQSSETCVLENLDAASAVRAMAAAMGSRAEIGAAAHRPPAPGQPALTAFRIEGFPPSVAARKDLLRSVLQPFGPMDLLDAPTADGFWDDLRTLRPLGQALPIWRINVPPASGSAVVDALVPDDEGRWLMDWAGGLVWLAHDGDADRVRECAANLGGHAMLLRAPEALRAGIPAFHPPAPGLAALETRVRRAFDPLGLFETGRF
jgi:glycolate oxidase FAD binding subunit